MVKFGLKFAALVWLASGVAVSTRAADPAVQPTWRATMRSGVVVPICPQSSSANESRLMAIGVGPGGESVQLADVVELTPIGISPRGPAPRSPVVVLANGDEVVAWPVMTDGRWTLESHVVTTRVPGMPGLTCPRGIVAAVRRTNGGALLDWPRGPFDEGVLREEGFARASGPAWRVIRSDSRVKLEPLYGTTIRRVEFRVVGATGEWALVDAGGAGSRLVSLSWSADFPELFRVVVRGDSAAPDERSTEGEMGEAAVPGARFPVRRPESPPRQPTVETMIVWESGAFGCRLWVGDRLVVERTTPVTKALACEWTGPAAVANVRSWLTDAPSVRSEPVGQPDLDAIELSDGSYLYGDLERFGRGEIQFAGGRGSSLDRVRSLRCVAAYPVGKPINGWIVDLHPKAGGPAWRVAVVGLSADAIEIVHPLLGDARIAGQEVTRLIPSVWGRQFLLEAGRIHLGDEYRADFAHPSPRGTGWSATVPAGRRALPEMNAGSTLVFRAGVRELGDGERVRSDLGLRVNGQRVGDLSTRVTPRNRDETVEIAIPAGLWKAAENRIEVVPENGAIGAAPSRNGAADDIELINPSLEWRTP